MILDAFLQFDSGILITAAATTPSTNTIDLHLNGLPVLAAGQGARDIGIGDDPAMKILVVVTAAFVGGTNVTVSLQGAPDNGAGAPGAFVTWYTSPAYTTAQLNVGSRLMDMDMPRPPDGVPVPRFIRLSYTSTGTYTGGAIAAYLVLDRFDQMYNATDNAVLGGYPPGIAVLN